MVKRFLIFLPMILFFSITGSCLGPFNPYDWPPEDEEPDTAAVPSNGLIAYWSCDDSAGTVLHDSANSLNGTIMGAEFVKGVRGTALQFDGKGNKVVLNNSESEYLMFGSGDFAISLLAKPLIWQQITDTSRFDIISRGVLRNKGYTITIFVKSFTALVGRSNYDQRDVKFDATEEAWFHLVLTRKSGNVEFYVNTEKIVSYSNDDDVSVPDSKLIIGDNSSSESRNGFSGIIDEIRMYNRALDIGKIRALYNGYGLK